MVLTVTKTKTMRPEWLLIFASCLFMLLCFPMVSYGAAAPRTLLNRLTANGKYLTDEELWFAQTLDHFSPYVTRLF